MDVAITAATKLSVATLTFGECEQLRTANNLLRLLTLLQRTKLFDPNGHKYFVFTKRRSQCYDESGT